MRTLASLLFSCLLAVSARAQTALDSLSAAAREPAPPAPATGPARPAFELHARLVLAGEDDHWVFLKALDPAANRAVIQRSPAWGPFGRTTVVVLARHESGWHRIAEVSRANGRWSPGVTLSALGLSADGRLLVYRVMEDKKDDGSHVYRALDLEKGGYTPIGPAVPGDAAREHAAIERTAWFQERFPGRRFAEAFPAARGDCGAALAPELSSAEKYYLRAEGRLTVRAEGAQTLAYPLSGVYRAQVKALYAADCSRGLVAADQLLDGFTRGFGSTTQDWRTHVLEIGRTAVPPADAP